MEVPGVRLGRVAGADADVVNQRVEKPIGVKSVEHDAHEAIRQGMDEDGNIRSRIGVDEERREMRVVIGGVETADSQFTFLRRPEGELTFTTIHSAVKYAVFSTSVFTVKCRPCSVPTLVRVRRLRKLLRSFGSRLLRVTPADAENVDRYAAGLRVGVDGSRVVQTSLAHSDRIR